MDSCLNVIENGGTERSRAHVSVRFMAIFVFHEFGLLLYRGVPGNIRKIQKNIERYRSERGHLKVGLRLF